MQRALGFAGTGVDTIFKGLQLDIGSPHQFMDFRFRLRDVDHGEFWLAHCGALMDVEPMGSEFVHGMCHTIEDPTFDATAVATNPAGESRPIHRPPRTPADRTPHCHWTVTIDAADDPVAPHPNVAAIESSRVASVEVDVPEVVGEPGGWDDYSGAFDPEFQLEDLSQRALAVTCQEVAVQSHLLIRSYLLAASQAFGSAEAAILGPRVFTGLSGITAQRLRVALAVGDGAVGIAKLIQLHPVFWPRTYVDLASSSRKTTGCGSRSARARPWRRGRSDLVRRVGRAGRPGARRDCAGGRPARPMRPHRRPLGRALCVRSRDRPRRRARDRPDEVVLAKISTGSAFVFAPASPVRS